MCKRGDSKVYDEECDEADKRTEFCHWTRGDNNRQCYSIILVKEIIDQLF